MGCINSSTRFGNWFGNIHFSGPCNRSCYFCIGQHMMELDPINNLGEWPPKNLREFIKACRVNGVKDVYLTGTNTDPIMYDNLEALTSLLAGHRFKVGVRTNGASHIHRLEFFDKASISIPSFDVDIYRSMMGSGEPPDLKDLKCRDVKINVVLGPENKNNVFQTIRKIASYGILKVNLREPYGQPNVGDPLRDYLPLRHTYGMPVYSIFGAEVTYWDVHYAEVNSVNLFADGTISEDYAITRRYSGSLPQESFTHGRKREQWL